MSNDPQPCRPWVYEGIWGLLGKLICVPHDASHLPAMEHEEIDSRKPAAGFLWYLKFEWSIAMVFLFMLAAGGTLAILILATNEHVGFLILAVPLWLVFFGLAFVGYLAIYLRHDTTWYVFSDRSMRQHRGFWLIRESTMTY